METATFLSFVFTLIMVMDPLGNIPLFISSLKQVPDNRKTRVVMRELFIALVIMLLFLFFGKHFVKALSLDLTSMAVGGGIILFIIGVQMIFPTKHMLGTDETDGEPFIVPMAVPLVAGPSVLTTVMLLSMQNKGTMLYWCGVVGAAWLVNAIILGGFSAKLAKVLGHRGLMAVEKLMGMILIAISTQMVMNGIKAFMQK